MRPVPHLAYSRTSHRAELEQLDDRALLLRVQESDELALDELVRRKMQSLVQVAWRILGDREEARDVVQVAFVRVWEHRRSYHPRYSANTWIYRIAVNQARNRHRFWRRRHRADQVSLETQVAAHGELSSGGESRPDRVFAQKELASCLQRALDHLPFDQRTAIILREIDGLSYEEIAYSLGIAIGTVKSRLTRARHTLRIELQEARM